MNKRRIAIVFMALGMVTCSLAQKRTTMPTVYRQYRPSVITFSDGHTSRQSLTNVFLKNSSLLFLRGEVAMEAEMSNIVKVEFEDRSYIKIGRQLAYLVDSVGTNALYCIELFDKEAYERNLKNNINISSMDIGDQISTTTVDLNNEEDYKLPVFKHYYFNYNDQIIKVHERELGRKLGKDKKMMMERIMAIPDFSWQDPQSLITLLKAISD